MGELRVTVCAVGDLMLGDHPLYAGIGVGSRLRRDRVSPLLGLSSFLRGVDLTVANLETPLSAITCRRGALAACLRGEPWLARALSEAGVSAVSVANNHALEHGRKAYDASLLALESAGMVVFGTADSPSALLNINGLRVGLLSASLRPEQNLPGQTAYFHPTDDELLAAVSKLTNQVDVTIVSLHWGDEYMTLPSRKQAALAAGLLRAGAHAILGHHAHVCQPVWLQSGRLVAFGLGNCVTDMCQHEARHGAILRFSLEKSGVTAAEIADLTIGEDYAPSLSGPWRRVQSDNPLDAVGLGEEYQREVDASVKRFRTQYESFFRRNWYRYPVRQLGAIVGAALFRRVLRPRQGDTQ